MGYKILEAEGFENENTDGAAFNNFSARGRSGILKGVLNQCALAVTTSGVIISTGELLLHGFRVKITDPYTVTSHPSASALTHYLIAKIELRSDKTVSFSIEEREDDTLTQDDLFQSNRGVYEAVLATFVTESTGVTGVSAVLPIIGYDVEQRLDDFEDELEEIRQQMEDLPSGGASSESLESRVSSLETEATALRDELTELSNRVDDLSSGGGGGSTSSSLDVRDIIPESEPSHTTTDGIERWSAETVMTNMPQIVIIDVHFAGIERSEQIVFFRNSYEYSIGGTQSIYKTVLYSSSGGLAPSAVDINFDYYVNLYYEEFTKALSLTIQSGVNKTEALAIDYVEMRGVF